MLNPVIPDTLRHTPAGRQTDPRSQVDSGLLTEESWTIVEPIEEAWQNRISIELHRSGT